MTDRSVRVQERTWVRHVQLGAEVAVAVGSGVLAVIDAIDRHRELGEEGDGEQSQLPLPLEPAEEDAP